MKQLDLIDRVSHLVNPTIHKCIAIVGLPSSGKSTLAMQISSRWAAYIIAHTDEFLDYPHASRLGIVTGAVRSLSGPVVIEGVMAYELLAHNLIHPDVVIMCAASEKTRFNRRGKETKTFDAQLNNYWQQWRSIDTNKNIIYNTTDNGLDTNNP